MIARFRFHVEAESLLAQRFLLTQGFGEPGPLPLKISACFLNRWAAAIAAKHLFLQISTSEVADSVFFKTLWIRHLAHIRPALFLHEIGLSININPQYFTAA